MAINCSSFFNRIFQNTANKYILHFQPLLYLLIKTRKISQNNVHLNAEISFHPAGSLLCSNTDNKVTSAAKSTRASSYDSPQPRSFSHAGRKNGCASMGEREGSMLQTQDVVEGTR